MASFLDDSRLAAPALDAPRQYVPERVVLSEPKGVKAIAALKNSERALLTFAILFSSLIGIFAFMGKYLPYFMVQGFLFEGAQHFYLWSICLLAPAILLLPVLFFRSLEVTYLLSVGLICIFFFGVSQALEWYMSDGVRIGKLEINMYYFCVFAALQMTCTIIAFILHGVRVHKQKQPEGLPERYRVQRPRQLKEPTADLKNNRDRGADELPMVQCVELQQV